MAELPTARVIRHAPWPDGNVLNPPPRRIPSVLWLRIVLGGTVAQGGWLGSALLLALVAGFRSSRRHRSRISPSAGSR